MQAFDVATTAACLAGKGGGHEAVHASRGLEIGVCELVAPEPDRQTPHAYDGVYVLLDGAGDLEVEGEIRGPAKGEAAFVAAGEEHRFSGYETLSLLVVFNGAHSASKLA